MFENDTIAAIATSLSNSGIGIIRVSGKDSISIVNKIYQPKNGKKDLNNVDSHTIHYGYICDRDIIIDEVLIMIMKAPNSFTAENTVEIDCHGGVLVMTKILETVIKYGARCAKPGEFTKRAFLNGRIDLSKAEAVMDIINSKNDLALKNSISQLKGSVYKKIIDLREKILFEIAFIESALDDPEHISLEGYSDKLQSNITKLIKEFDIILQNFNNGKILKEGVRTVILGKPNAGKSSLLNLLIGEEKAIVTEIAGTTRDAIEETVNLNGVTLNLIDTAGIRETDDIVEKIGVERSLNYANKADLIIYVVDASKPLDENDFQIMNIINDTNVIILINKTDLTQVVNEEDIRSKIDAKIIPISARNNIGINLLEDTIKNMFYNNNISFNDEIIITNIRQKDAIEKANDSCKFVLKSIKDQMPEDFYSIDLMSAYSSLGEVIGEEVDEDLVNKIFREFCTGK